MLTVPVHLHPSKMNIANKMQVTRIHFTGVSTKTL